MAEITINKKKYEVEDGITIIQACEQANIEIPRFCYHEKLAIAGNCRMCLVEVVGGPPKPVASCAMPVANGMEVFTDSEMVKKAREGVMEFLLANHPLDCPICDQGGECDLQDQAYQYGKGSSEFIEQKRAVKDKNLGPLIKTHMTRCIHCTRCVRFMEDVAGTNELGAIFRGENMEITSYLEESITSELSGNIIDLCPVGALTSKPYAFKARSWELKKTDSIDIMDAVGSNIRIDSKGLEVMRILPRLEDDINEEWISDKARFCYDGIKYQRLDKSYIKQDGRLQTIELEKAIDLIAKKISETTPDKIAFLSGKLSSLEEIFILKNIAEKLKIKKTECRLANQNIDDNDRSSFIFNSSISSIEEADFCLLIGTNPRKDAPILNARIRKRFISGDLKIASLGCNENLTYKTFDLGLDASELCKILDGKSEISDDLKKAQKPILIIGEDATSNDEGIKIIEICKKIAQKYNFIQENWNGFNFLAKSTGLVNGLSLNFTYQDNINGIEKDCEEKNLDILLLHGVDDDISFDKIKNCFVIYIGSHGDKGAHNADLIVPANCFAEKEAIYMNIEGKIQKTQRAVFSLTGALDDFDILLKISEKLNLSLDFKNITEARELVFKKLNTKIDCKIKVEFKEFSKNIDKISGEIKAKDYDYYLTNQIARSSRILNKCSSELVGKKAKIN